MRRKTRLTIAPIALIAAILACNLPNTQPPTDDNQVPPEIKATLAEGLRNGADVPITATFSPIPRPSVTSVTTSPTPSTPLLTLVQQVDCRAGPGQSYESLFIYPANTSLAILGRYDAENYWLVQSPESSRRQCWISGAYGQASGNLAEAPNVTPPPPPAAQQPLHAPSSQSWNYTCAYNGNGYNIVVALTWSDKSNNETGFRVLRNGGLIADLPANSTAYTDSATIYAGQTFVYRIETYNSAGTAGANTAPISCS
ncbi:MAG TPA: hypothetical protein PLM89_00055 [Anaerolineales bacterium]|nr:hypothetical protein [Anaerolineales bacterium]